MKLTALQKASKEHIISVFQRKKENTQTRYLLADEVGLGKTKIAAAVINELAKEKTAKNPDNKFIVYYICGNQRVTNQNKNKLIGDCKGVTTKDVRITMQGEYVGDYQNAVESVLILPLTPAITFTSMGSKFEKNEFEYLKDTYDKEAKKEEFEALRNIAFVETIKNLLPPDLIILDEFQNYNGLLEDYLKATPTYPRFSQMMKKAPCLLLSATPFKVKSGEVHDLDPYEDEISTQETTEEKPNPEDEFFVSSTLTTTEESFQTVFHFVVGEQFCDKTHDQSFMYQNFFCRTERAMFMEKEEIMTVETLPTIAQTMKHLSYNQDLLNHCETGMKGYEGNKPSSNHQNWVKIAPSPLNFATRYKSLKLLGEGDSGFLNLKPVPLALEKGLSVPPDGHAGFAMLQEAVLPQGVEELLWIPPTLPIEEKYQNEDNPFWKHRHYTKTLVFCKYRMSTASTAYFMCQERKNRNINQKTMSPQGDCKDDKEYYQNIWESSQETGKCFRKYVEEVVFSEENMPLVRCVTTIYGNDPWAIARYARMGGLKQVVEEYLFLGGDPSLLKHEPSEICLLTGTGADKYSIEKLGFAERFTAQREGITEIKLHTDHESLLQAQFNSPFYPFMLSATKTAQEGLDFHHYCHRMVHFSMPDSPVEFIQREGRMDRYRSHLVRKRLALRFQEKSMTELFAKAAEYSEETAKLSPLFPNWYVSEKEIVKQKEEEEPPVFHRQVWAMPASKEEVFYQQLQQAVAKYRTYMGSHYENDRESFCPFLNRSCQPKL